MNQFLREGLEGLRDLIVQTVRRVRRTQPGPVLLRLVAALAAAAAMALAAPSNVVSSSQAGLLVPFAIGVALFPRTRFITATATLTLLLWLLATLVIQEQPQLWRVGLLAASLYVMHSAAAVAAVLPYDAAVSRDVLLRWAARVSAVTVVGVAVGLAGMVIAGNLPAQRSVVGPMVGSILAALLVGVIALQVRRRG